MYGLLLEGIGEAIKRKYGEQTWQTIRKKAGITHHSFITHKTYSETVIPRLTKASHEVTNAPVDELMELFGTTFVSFVSQYGYDRVMRVLGRNLRDFLNGLDNLHEYLRFSYPKLKPPSFFCENENRKGLTLHYRSKRKGFLYYVMGQITEVAKTFYATNVEIELMSEEETLDMTHVVMKLSFDNSGFKEQRQEVDADVQDALPISSDIFFDVFPFHIVFNRSMVIKNIGSGLAAVMSHIVGQAIDEMFMLTRPMVEFTMENIMGHTNNVFMMTTIDKVHAHNFGVHTESSTVDDVSDDDDPDDKSRRLRLKGQMMYMSDWDAIIFLGTPIMENLERMFETGLYINDLSMHDSSRDLVLAGTQQSAELKLALDQEQQKSKKLEESMKRLDIEMKRTDQLLYQMIPKAVADRLRRGEPAMATCETFKLVTILFSDVVGFTSICSNITPLQVVGLLNGMYTQFDLLSEKHKVYKVETIGDAYMVVSGAPIATTFHSLYICDMAFDMLEAMKELIDPHSGNHLKIRVGVHSGSVVAGVVGVKMPRYCLFGDTVNTANRMESSGTPMKIHISETTREQLAKYPYTCEDASTIDVKGETLKTYFLTGKDTSMGSALNYMKEDNADMEGNTSTGAALSGVGGGGGGGGAASARAEFGQANFGKQATYFTPPEYDEDVLNDLRNYGKQTTPMDIWATDSISSKGMQDRVSSYVPSAPGRRKNKEDAETPSPGIDLLEEMKIANQIFKDTKLEQEIELDNKRAEEYQANDAELEKGQMEEKEKEKNVKSSTTVAKADPSFHPDCMWLEMVFLMAEAQEQGIPPHEFFKSIYGENNQSGVPQCAFFKAFADAEMQPTEAVPATG